MYALENRKNKQQPLFLLLFVGILNDTKQVRTHSKYKLSFGKPGVYGRNGREW